jgi:choline dehydrogenase-like flavoprotein
MGPDIERSIVDIEICTIMVIDLEQANVAEVISSHFDVCIAGAGAAGLVLAIELIKQGKHVVVVESGGLRRWERRTQALNKSEIVGLPHSGVHSGRFRALGGTTRTWAGQIMELDEIDFVRRDWVPGSGWPIAKSDLKTAYLRAIELEGLAGSLPDDEAIWNERSSDPPDIGDDFTFSFSRFCPEHDFARLFKEEISSRPEMFILLHATVCELILAEDGETVTSVRCRTLSGVETCLAADRFVLCLGGIESSRFLLQPYRSAAWNRNGLVGRFFQDHIHCFAADIFDAKLDENWHYGPDRWSFHGYEYSPKIKLSPEAQRRYQVLNAAGLVEYDDFGVFSAYRAAILLIAGPTLAITPKDLRYLLLRAPYVLWSYVKNRTHHRFTLPHTRLKLSVFCEQSPLSDSRITLTDKRDALGLFRARIDWKVSAQEVSTIRRYVQLAKRVFAERGLARIEPDPDLMHDGIVHRFRDQFHHLGGTRMASSPVAGVVDPNLRLFGTRNAYVCSSAVFPASGFANPTHTVAALAVRLAWHLSALPTIRQTVSRKTQRDIPAPVGSG